MKTANQQPIGAQAHYEQALANGVFEIQQCEHCEQHIFYPRQLCPHCGSMMLRWIAPSGWGSVYSTTTVCLDPKNPHNVCLIDLDEGVRLMSRVDGVPPSEVVIGQRVQARIIQEDGKPLLVFTATEAMA